ncbi:hypothetical protein M0813_13287 [Anaeramoeba flamelloides]|uniref:Uncharacterized protein n=1 Tax=Anaeramoeba flamelloides TaxID=1746091 RepID=A0ABQ8ZAI8_9EUKA|nr:hypothetical protein M0813_13287 [Anaeramoeba flamelloides]
MSVYRPNMYAMSDRMIDEAKKCGDYSDGQINYFRKTKDSYEEIDVLHHRQVQENMRKKYNIKEDQDIWKKNNQTIHNTDPKNQPSSKW